MKVEGIKVGRRYVANISGKRAIVQVMGKLQRKDSRGRPQTHYAVCREGTTRRLVFRSARRFLETPTPETWRALQIDDFEAEQEATAIKAEGTPSVCSCGHTGGSPNSEHKDTRQSGHGSCKKCKCGKFRWSGFIGISTPIKHMPCATGEDEQSNCGKPECVVENTADCTCVACLRLECARHEANAALPLKHLIQPGTRKPHCRETGDVEPAKLLDDVTCITCLRRALWVAIDSAPRRNRR